VNTEGSRFALDVDGLVLSLHTNCPAVILLDVRFELRKVVRAQVSYVVVHEQRSFSVYQELLVVLEIRVRVEGDLNVNSFEVFEAKGCSFGGDRPACVCE